MTRTIKQNMDAKQRSVFPTQSSVLEEDALLRHVVRDYAIAPAKSCRFFDRGDSDIYRVETAEHFYYLKVYRPPNTKEQAESEARFVHRLAEADLPVVRPIPRHDGVYASVAYAGEGARPILLFEEAPSPLPRTPSENQILALGSLVARVHEIADSEPAPKDIPSFDLETLDKERIPAIRTFATTEEDTAFLADAMASIRPTIEGIPKTAPEWGLCHADLVLSNARGDAQGVWLFDFGNLAHTYRGFDLSIVYWSLGHRDREKRDDLWAAFLDGYTAIRPLPAKLTERLPAFLAMWELAFLGGNAESLPLRLGTVPFESAFMHDGFDRIREILSPADMEEQAKGN